MKTIEISFSFNDEHTFWITFCIKCLKYIFLTDVINAVIFLLNKQNKYLEIDIILVTCVPFIMIDCVINSLMSIIYSEL